MRVHHFGLSMGCVAALLAGCAAPGALAPAPGAVAPSPAAAPAARVAVTLGAVPAIVRTGRRALAYGEALDEFPIRKLRLRVSYPDQVGVSTILSTIPWDPGTEVSPTLPARLYGAITPGNAIVLTVEALGDGDAVLLQLRGATNVEAGQTASVKLNFIEDTVAGAVEELKRLAADPPEGSAYRVLDVPAGDMLADPALVTTLRSFVTEIAGYDEATNTYRHHAPYRLAKNLLATVATQAYSLSEMTESGSPPFTSYNNHGVDISAAIRLAPEDVLPALADPKAYRLEAIVPGGENDLVPAGDPGNGYWRLSELAYYDFGPSNHYFQTTDCPPGTYTVVVTHLVSGERTFVTRRADENASIPPP